LLIFCAQTNKKDLHSFIHTIHTDITSNTKKHNVLATFKKRFLKKALFLAVQGRIKIYIDTQF